MNLIKKIVTSCSALLISSSALAHDGHTSLAHSHVLEYGLLGLSLAVAAYWFCTSKKTSELKAKFIKSEHYKH